MPYPGHLHILRAGNRHELCITHGKDVENPVADLDAIRFAQGLSEVRVVDLRANAR
jgi:hypothetical protein